MGRGAPTMLMKRVPGMTEEQAKKFKYSFINVWKPTIAAVEQFPLAFLDWRTCEDDHCHEVELGYSLTPTNKTGKGGDREKNYFKDMDSAGFKEKESGPTGGFYKPRISQVVHRPGHHWAYYPHMKIDEAFIFTQYDQRFDPQSPRRFAKHTFHTAFFDESAPEEFRRRTSMEIRFLCAFDDDAAGSSKL